MKISYKDDYALKVILHLSRRYPNEPVRIEELSKRQDIPKKFLEQILILLKNGGFVRSKRGPKGGYYLAKNPANISLGEVVRYVSGTVYPIACIDPAVNQHCDFKSRCVFVPIWQKVGDQISGIIDNISFADLAEQDSKLQNSTPLDFQI
jgi:Rrf2 family protein